jgi:hypothetical protein
MYKNPISPNTYSKLNKDKSINKYFKSDSVGKCMKLIDDYYQSTDNFCKLGWENYYLTEERKNRLNDIYKELREEQQEVLGVDLSDYIFYRVLGQTYNGYVAELNILKELKKSFPKLDFIKATYELDEKYFTDFEVYTGGLLIFGGQIKPISYLYMSTPYQKRAKENHKRQRDEYVKKFNVPHYLLYYDENGLYEKENICNKINTILALKNNTI